MIARREFFTAAAVIAASYPTAAYACRSYEWDFGSERSQIDVVLERMRGNSPEYPEAMFSGVEPGLSEGITEFRARSKNLGSETLEIAQFKRFSDDVYLVNFRRKGFEEFIVSCDGVVGSNNYFLARFRHGRLDAFERADIFDVYNKVKLNA